MNLKKTMTTTMRQTAACMRLDDVLRHSTRFTYMINESLKPLDVRVDIGIVLARFDGHHLLLNVTSSK